MNTIDRLVMMANQIAANLRHEPDPALALVEHIELFWDMRMKEMIMAHGGEGLSAVAASAIPLIGKRYEGSENPGKDRTKSGKQALP